MCSENDCCIHRSIVVDLFAVHPYMFIFYEMEHSVVKLRDRNWRLNLIIDRYVLIRHDRIKEFKEPDIAVWE